MTYLKPIKLTRKIIRVLLFSSAVALIVNKSEGTTAAGSKGEGDPQMQRRIDELRANDRLKVFEELDFSGNLNSVSLLADEQLARMTAENERMVIERKQREIQNTERQERALIAEHEKQSLHLGHDLAADVNFFEARERQTLEKEKGGELDKFGDQFIAEKQQALIRQKAREIAKETYKKEVEKSIQELKNENLRRQTLLDESSLSWSPPPSSKNSMQQKSIEEQFNAERSAIQQKNEKREHVTVKFPGDTEISVREDILNLFPILSKKINTRAAKKELIFELNIKPSTFKKICSFFEAALTMDSEGKTLVAPDRDSTYKYTLFKKNLNVLLFLKEKGNIDIIDALIKMCESTKVFTKFDYNYSYPPTKNSVLHLISRQLSDASSFSYNKNEKITEMLILTSQLFDKIDANKRDEIIQTFGENSKIIMVDCYYWFLGKLNSLDAGLYPSINNILRLTKSYYNMDGSIIIDKLNPELYQFFDQFMNHNISFFTYVPYGELYKGLTKEMTQSQLRTYLESLHTMYYRAPTVSAPTSPGLVFEIHDFSNQPIQNKGTTKKFNDVVLAKVIELLGNKTSLSYEKTIKLMQDKMDELIAEDKERTSRGEKTHYSSALTRPTLDWAVNSVNGCQTDSDALITIVTYLTSKADDSFKTWFITFMDESKKAYDGKSSVSCVKGIRERVITSLRNINDPAFEEIFRQAEAALMFTKKMATLNNMELWAKRLFEGGIRTTTPVLDAKKAYIAALSKYFEDVKIPAKNEEIQDVINEMTELFEDSEIAMDGSVRRERGTWTSKLMPELQKLESSPGSLNFN